MSSSSPTTPSYDGYPAWSPDGQEIAFTTNRAGSPPYNADVFVMNADGRERKSTNSPGVDDGIPAWSPDGTKIAYLSGSEIFVT